jgi:hypothetical protein
MARVQAVALVRVALAGAALVRVEASGPSTLARLVALVTR